VRDADSGWHGDIAGSANRPHGLYLVLALASGCDTEGGGGARTVWFLLEDPAGTEAP
jgi:hypothetical protein